MLYIYFAIFSGVFIMPLQNLAICWKILKFKYNYLNLRQSAGNLKGLSLLRILRDYTPEFMCRKFSFVNKNDLNFLSFSSITNNSDLFNKIISSNNINYNLSSYLTGLIEGDGSIIVPKSERSIKGKLNYPSIQIVFDLRDFPLALVIQQKLGHGSLSRKKGVNAYILTINNFEGLILVVKLINGYMRTPKIKSLFNLID